MKTVKNTSGKSRQGKKQGNVSGWLDRALALIPRIMASRLSVFIFLFLFVYLVIYTLLCIAIPTLNDFAPDDNIQTVLGNYTNILSALGAAIAAGSGAAIHSRVKVMDKDHAHFRGAMNKSHAELKDSVSQLHEKIDKLNKAIAALEKEK